MKKLLTIENFLCLLTLSAPFYLVKVSFFGIPTNAFELFGVFLLALFLALQRKTFFEETKNLPRVLLVSIFAILLGVIASTLANDNWKSGFGILKGWFILPILFSFAIYAVIKSEESIEKLFASICYSIAIVSLIALVYKMQKITTYDGRLSAFYLSPNHLAMYLSCGIFFPFYFFVKGILQKNILKTTLSTTILLLVILSLFFTFSYGAWIAVSLALAFTVIIFSKRKFLFSLFLVLIVAFAFLLQFDSEKFEALRNFSERSSLASRMMIWKTSLLMLKQSPILGIGPGNFQNTYLSLQKFFPPYLEWAVPQPHNIFLAFWLQSGIIGFAGFFLIVFHAIKNLLKIKGMDFSLHIPLVGFFFYTLLHGLVDTPFWKNDLAFLFWLNLFLAAAIWKIATKKPVSLETDRVQL